jgi:spore coat protein H
MARVLLTLLAIVVSVPAAAQTADDFFNPNVLHRIDLLVNSRDWEKLKANFQLNDYYPADLRWNGITVRNAGIRSRGLGSRNAEKPGLRFDANRYTSGQTFLGLKSFILDNLTQDPSGIRERVAMRFFERMGLPAPREAHAELYVNNQYSGVYALVESIDKDFLKRVFGERDGDTENDGYLFEYEYETAWHFTYLGADLDAYAPRFDPVTHENASKAALYGPIEAMVRAMNEASDATFVQTVGQYLDLPLFMKHVAVQAFLAEWDGILGYAGVNNFYLYRFENSDRSQFIAWDADNTFKAVDFTILQGHEENVLMRRAMQVPALRAAYFDALLAAAGSAMEGGWLENEMQLQRQLVSTPMRADTLKPFSNEQFEGSMAELVDFARRRAAIVRCEVAKMVDPPAAGALCAQAATATR